MDRHWNTTIKRSKVLCSVKSNHSIFATWSISSSRNRRSDPPQWHSWRVQEEEVRRRFALVTWRKDIKTGKGRRSEENISILCEFKLSQSSPVPSSNSRTVRRKCFWSCVARQFPDSERIYRVPLPRREREWIEFYNKKWINSRRNKPQKRKTSSLLHYRESDGGRIWHGRHSMRSDRTNDRAIQEYLETISKYSILVQFEARPRERSAIFQTPSHAVVLYNTLQLALRKRYVWKLRMSSTRRYA